MKVPLLRRLAVLVALVGLSVTASTTASLPPVGLAQERGSTLVTVDFRVLARDGSPVIDLKPEEVALKVGGRDREVVALELVNAAGGATSGETALTPPFVTNVPPSGGRLVMLLVDEESIPPGHTEPVKDALNQLVAALSPGDRVGLRALKGGVTTTKPTVRRDRVLAAINALEGRSTPTEAVGDAACRTTLARDALLSVFEGAVPSVSTVAVLVSNGLTGPTTSSMSSGRTASSRAVDAPCEFTSGDLAALTTAAAASRVQVYGLAVFRGADVSGGMENFSNLSGNAMVKLTGDTKPQMTRIARETAAYYVAAFEVTEQERTGSSQRVAVTVSRPEVQVKAQPMVVIAKPAAKGPSGKKPKLSDISSASTVFRDLPLRATVHTSRATQDGKLRVFCVFDSSDPSVKFAEASVAMFDNTGKPRAQWTALPAGLKGSPIVAAFIAPGPGTYRLRLAAIDASGAPGTLDEEVRIEADTPGTVKTSALVLGTQGAAGFARRLQFVDEQVAIAMVEIYGAPKTATVDVMFEVAASEEGAAKGSLAGTVSSPRDDLRTAFVSFPIAQVSAGDFVIRAVITVDGQPLATKPAHTLRKVER
jgi:hypothetical protein